MPHREAIQRGIAEFRTIVKQQDGELGSHLKKPWVNELLDQMSGRGIYLDQAYWNARANLIADYVPGSIDHLEQQLHDARKILSLYLPEELHQPPPVNPQEQ